MIKIKNLRLKTIIGVFDWERKQKQDVIFNITIHFDLTKAALTDNITNTLDYDALTQKITTKVENSNYFLIEALGKAVMDIIMAQDGVISTTVEVDKPGAINSADSVSIVFSS